MKVTNTQKGPRGLNAKTGPVLVEPGETVEIELSSEEKAVAEGTGWFEFGGKAKDPLDHDNDGKKGGSAPKAD